MTRSAPLLTGHLVVDRGDFRLDITLSVTAGEVVALLGPNGAGKTTVVRALAGLIPLTAGRIHLGDRPLDDPHRRLWTPPERRRIGVVFQDYLLFPHLSVLDNVAFGPRSTGTNRRTARGHAATWLDRVGLTAHAHRRPRALSGGQAQRVALARALAVNPDLLLLDEPLAALDAQTRPDTRAQLHRHLQAHPGATILVTHDPLDALVLADRLVIIEDGRIVQEGDAANVTAHPRTDYVARLVGLNLYRGSAAGTAVTIPAAGRPYEWGVGAGAHAEPRQPGRGAATSSDATFQLFVAEPVDGEVFIAFPPSAVALHPHQPDGSPRNAWPTTIAGIQRHGDNLRIELDGPIPAAADITPAAAAQLHLAPGARVWAAVKATETRAYPVVPVA